MSIFQLGRCEPYRGSLSGWSARLKMIETFVTNINAVFLRVALDLAVTYIVVELHIEGAK